MSDSIQKYLDFHKEAGGTGKLFNFKLISYQEDCLELEGEFSDETLNPDGSVQGGRRPDEESAAGMARLWRGGPMVGRPQYS